MNSTDEKLKEGVEHLQTAAVELIAAVRVFLDVAEQAVREGTERMARAGAGGGTGHGPNGDPGVEHIRVV